MSENNTYAQRRDAGMTLPELLISVVVIGIIATVIAASITVTFRTQRSTDGRLNVARAEQSVSTWLPADLSSAVSATDLPGESPCGAPTCPGVGTLNGSNALLLTWPNPDGGTTTVSYVYRQASDGVTFELVRVECSGSSCKMVTVLHDLAGPTTGTFTPGVTPVPDEVINVTIPLAVDAESESGPTDETSGARRIVVTINGGGTAEGDGGGVNRVSITAGGTNLDTLAPEKATGPSFLKARSRCGGPITIIVDDSGSIGNAGAGATVEGAVRGFVKALAGTPTQVQIVKFSNESVLIDESGSWNKYYDMTDAASVTSLVGDDDGSPAGLIRSNLDQSGGTNWEDAIYRTFYSNTQVGTRLDNDGDPTTFLPGLIVFFTDGEPTYNMTIGTGQRSLASAPAGPTPRTKPKWPTANGQAFDQEGYDRAEYWINDFRNSEDFRIVGVGVGGIASAGSKVFAFNDSVPQSYSRGIVYSGANVYRRSSSGGTTGSAFAKTTQTEKVLGNFVVGGALTTAGAPYVKATYNSATGEWTNIDAADLFVTTEWNALPEALTAIALGECGGTLTMQTRLTDGSIAETDVSYETQGEIVTTSRVTRAASFDFTFPTGAPIITQVTPQDFATTGYSAQSWACSAKGAPLDAARWSLVEAGDPSKGINVELRANEAVSCTLTVATS